MPLSPKGDFARIRGHQSGPDYEAADRVGGLFASNRGKARPQKLVAKRWIIATYMLPFRIEA